MLRPAVLVTGLTAVVWSLTSPMAESAAPAKGNAANGKKLYASSCLSCHGPDAKGLKGLGKNLVTSKFVKSKTDAQLVAFLKVGRPTSDKLNTTGVAMPPKGGNPSLDDKKLLDLVAYLRSIAK